MERRIIAGLLLIGTISGCISTPEPETGGVRANYGRGFGPPTVPGVMGPMGEKFPMAAPFNSVPPGNEYAARMIMNQNVPLNAVQMNPSGMLTPPNVSGMPGMMPGMPGLPGPGGMPGMMPGGMPPGGMPPGMMPPGGNPFQKTSMGGLMPGGLTNANVPPGAKGPGDVTRTQFAASSPTGPLFPAQRTQVFFPKPAGMKVYWFAQGPDGKPSYSTTPLETPGRYNFAQAAIYRLKLTHIPGRPALELYPTLEVVPTSPKTNEFLAHNSVPVEFTEEDFKQVVDRNYIVKVIYLPDPAFQDAAGAGPDEIVSTRLEPGQDPIQEALRRGSILLVLRIGNIDQGLQHSPAMTAPVPGGPPALMKPPGMGVMPGFQVPFPTSPVTPDGAPNLLPFPGGAPPVFVPKLPAAPDGKLDVLPPPKKEGDNPKKEGDKLIVPSIDLPAPPGLDSNIPKLPDAPVPMPVEVPKGAIEAPAKTPVIPASTSKERETSPQLPLLNLPGLPAADVVRPELPLIPTTPPGNKK